ncbi:MAG: glycosyltransferase family 1 protein [Planctomycetota bacterium]
MKILMNATDGPLSLRAIRRYVLEMAAGLGHPDSGVDLHLMFLTHRVNRIRRFLKQLPAETSYRLRVVPVPRRICYDRYEETRRELRWLTKGMDLYHETTTDSPRFLDTPVLTTIHGCCPLVRPDILDPGFVRGKSAWFDRAVRNSGYFTTVSATSREEFLERFPVARELVRPIPLGVSEQFSHVAPEVAQQAVQETFGWDQPYVLYVGGIQHNKNIPVVLHTFQRLLEGSAFNGNLVLAGDLHYPEEMFRSKLQSLGIADRVRTPGCFPPEDQRLATLYRGASLFLFPSFYEGWTSPPLEAMACGTPVIASAASSIPETVGSAALTVDPEDPEGWAEAAARVLADRNLAADLREAGIARAAEYPWSRTVGSTIEMYSDILNGNLAAQPEAFTPA